MTYKEEVRDLFSVTSDYYLAHCISADFALGKGIAVEFNKRFDMKNRLNKTYPNYLDHYHNDVIIGDCILVGRVLNLVTKERYYEKPTYMTLTGALCRMAEVCEENGVQKIAIPIIGCGLDRLDWTKVRGHILGVFGNTDVEVLVCKKG